jgi:hypothetical protein
MAEPVTLAVKSVADGGEVNHAAHVLMPSKEYAGHQPTTPVTKGRMPIQPQTDV